MTLKRYCKNNTPVRIADDQNGGKRYECFYCKSKWRIIEVYNTLCSFCDSHGVNIKNNKIKCRLCGTEHNNSNYMINNVLVFW